MRNINVKKMQDNVREDVLLPTHRTRCAPSLKSHAVVHTPKDCLCHNGPEYMSYPVRQWNQVKDLQ